MNEQTEGRRRIQLGLLVSHLDEDFDSNICEGAMLAAEQADVNLFIFPGRYINGVYADKIRTEYEYQYNTLFQIPVENKFDVLLVLAGTLASHLDKKQKEEFLSQFSDTPIITIASQIGDYPCIMVDNRAGMKQVITHLTDVHGCRNIGFVSGPKTSEDALERLDVYKEVLAEKGIEYDESKVVYGNFSKYVAPIVGELLDRHPDLEAIVFANDQMASAGYQAMEERGIRPGVDILCTGFDNDPVSEELIPHLTTVKADPSEVGYNAVIEAVNYINNGTLENDTVPATMICRNSCGCQDTPELECNDEKVISDSGVMTRSICDFLLNKYRTSSHVQTLCRRLTHLIDMIISFAEKESEMTQENADAVCRFADGICDGLMFRLVNIYDLYAAMDYLHRMLIKLNGSDNVEHVKLNKLLIRIHRIIAERNSAYCAEKLDDAYFLTWQTNSITRDMLVFEAYDDCSYQGVVDKLTRLHMTSSYLYCYEDAVINLKNDKWHIPNNIMLKSYHNRSEAVLLPPEKQHIEPNELVSNPYLPKDRRFSMVVSPLFSNEEHYGILMCEIEHEYFNYIQSVTVQLCAALKIIALMKLQALTQRQLRQSLNEIKENNQLLSDLSKQDELTGTLNRRGFFEEVRKRLRRDDNYGKDAIMVFADLDYLKVINDTFGHEEGDFAIRASAEILCRAFNESGDEILGRIGGDEFVMCVFSPNTLSIPEMREKVEEVTEEYNKEFTADKDYIVHTSIGVYPFKCNDTVEIGELLSHADTLLYERKKHKKPILKAELT